MDVLKVSNQNSFECFFLTVYRLHSAVISVISHRSEDIQALFKIDEMSVKGLKRIKSACSQFLTNLYVPKYFTETCIANNGQRN
jgi:hypothetical protein